MLWDVQTGRLLCTAACPPFGGIALAPGGEFLACGGDLEDWVHGGTRDR